MASVVRCDSKAITEGVELAKVRHAALAAMDRVGELRDAGVSEEDARLVAARAVMDRALLESRRLWGDRTPATLGAIVGESYAAAFKALTLMQPLQRRK